MVTGLNAPQQMALDEAHNVAYVVEYAATGNLWRINLTSGVKTAVLSTLTFAVGIALSADLQYAYITEQTTGPETGRTSLFVTERDPANRVTRVDVTSGNSNVVSAVAFRPSSVSLAGASRLLMCCDQVIESVDLVAFQPRVPC